jgi:hypothetical protein
MKFPSLFETVALNIVFAITIWLEQRRFVVVICVAFVSCFEFILSTLIDFIFCDR